MTRTLSRLSTVLINDDNDDDDNDNCYIVKAICSE